MQKFFFVRLVIKLGHIHNNSWICLCSVRLTEMNREGRRTKHPMRDGDRGQWASKTEYVLVVAGNVVGLGNVWRFPYLCYKNGGGAFLVPYTLFAVVSGIPLFLMETSFGQYTQEGFITCWNKLCPLAKGIGYGLLMMKLYVFGYILVQAWALFYLFFSFRSQLPWASCDNTWNTVTCLGLQSLNSSNLTVPFTNTTSAATEFWERRVLNMSSGIEELGSIRWELALCLLVSWLISSLKVKYFVSFSKVAYFTATFPYVMLLILLIRGITLPGAWDGIYYYLYPDINRLVWMEASSQIFFSYSLVIGTLNVLGSYNDYHNNCYKDCFWLCLLNSGTSFVAGFVVFSVLGFMAQKQGVSVDNVADSGPGLAFVAYPQATAMMPLPQLWTVCFFLMLILLTFVSVESVITSVCDLHPKLFRAPMRREMFVLFICSSFFLLHLSMVTEGGVYIFQLIDYYGCTRACQDFMTVCLCLATHIPVLLVNFDDFQQNYHSVVLRFVNPFQISFILHLVDYKHLKINEYVYPDWAYALGWTITLSSVLMVPLWAAGQLCFTPGTFIQVGDQELVDINKCYWED
uniref:Transporter n=1 Tax=Kryptolebias marmoratus TaxID=37003 RepID=A0A3Q3GFN9_KRYMA